MHFSQVIAPVFATVISVANASPFDASVLNGVMRLDKRSGVLNLPCTFYISYSVTNQQIINETPVLITGANVGPNPAGGSLAAGYTYSKSVGYTGGISGSFDLKEVFNFGATASVSISYTEGTSISASQNCPANVVCGLEASASLLQVTGNMRVHRCGPWETSANCAITYESTDTTCTESTYNGSPFDTNVPFTATYPRIDSSASLVNGQDAAIVNFRACTIGTGVTGLDACPLPSSPSAAEKGSTKTSGTSGTSGSSGTSGTKTSPSPKPAAAVPKAPGSKTSPSPKPAAAVPKAPGSKNSPSPKPSGTGKTTATTKKTPRDVLSQEE